MRSCAAWSASSGTRGARRVSGSRAEPMGRGGAEEDAHAPSSRRNPAVARPAKGRLLGEAVTVHAQGEGEEGLQTTGRLELLWRPILFPDGLVEAGRRVDKLLKACRI